MSPLTSIRNADSFSTNSFPYALSRLFRNRGYRVSAFHMNSQEYYSRGVNYRNWGYHHFYSLRDSEKLHKGDVSFLLDSTLVSEKGFYSELFESKQPFFHYIITYTIHYPFRMDCCHGKEILKEKGLGRDCSSGECAARIFARETDQMVGDLLDGLRRNSLISNTVIVAFTDHFPHLLANESLFTFYKGSDRTLWNRTPFFIWAKNISPSTISYPTSHIDICPTILNLFGIPYKDEYYMGKDVYSSSHPRAVLFRDGTIYNGLKHSACNPDMFDRFIKKNDLTLQMDYFRNIK